MWVILGGFAVIGAAFYGGPLLVASWQDASQARARRRARAAAITREAAEGIADIEAFLTRRTPPPDHAEEPADRQEDPSNRP
jgi:hypothetical protein